MVASIDAATDYVISNNQYPLSTIRLEYTYNKQTTVLKQTVYTSTVVV